MGKQQTQPEYLSQEEYDKKLDTEISTLIDNDFSDEDIKIYGEDFKSRFSVKKKDQEEVISPTSLLDGEKDATDSTSVSEQSIPNKIEVEEEITMPKDVFSDQEDRGLKLKDRASKSLRESYKSSGIKDYEITDDQITKEATRINEIDKKLKKEGKKLEDFDFWGESWKKMKANTNVALSNLVGVPNYLNKTLFTLIADDKQLELANSLDPKSRELLVNAMFTNPVSNPIGSMGQISAEKQEEIKAKADIIQKTITNFDSNIVDDIGKGDLKKAGLRIASEGIGSIPSMVQAMIPYVGIGSIVAGSASGKQEELESEGYKLGLDTSANAIINGAAEGLLEVVTKKIGGNLFKSLKGTSTTARQTIAKGLVENLVKAPLKEGASEAATTAIQNLSDAFVQGKEVDLTKAIKDVIDAGLIGAASGGAMGSATNVSQEISRLKDDIAINKVINDKGNNYKTIKDIYSTEGPDKFNIYQLEVASHLDAPNILKLDLNKAVNKGEITKDQSDLYEEKLSNAVKVLKKTEGIEMTPEKRVEASNLIEKKDKLKEEVSGLDDVLASPKKKEIEEINNQLEELVKTEPKETETEIKEDTSKEVDKPQDTDTELPETSTQVDTKTEPGITVKESEVIAETEAPVIGTETTTQQPIEKTAVAPDTKTEFSPKVNVKTKSNNYDVSVENGELKIKPEKGDADISIYEKNKVVDEYIAQTDFSKGEVVNFEGKGELSETQVSQAIADESSNPLEVANEIIRIENTTSDKADLLQTTKDDAIANVLRAYALNKDAKKEVTDLGSYYTNRANKQSENIGIDKARELAESELGAEVSTQDVLNFLENYPSITQYNEVLSKKNPELNDLKQKFKDLTGLNPTSKTLNKIKEKQKVEPKAVKEKESEGGKARSFTARASKAEGLSESAKLKLKELDLNYDVESQAQAQKNAETIIDEIGLSFAYELATEGQITGGAKTWIQSKMFEDLNQKIFEANDKGDLELVDSLSGELAKIMNYFANEKKLSGQEAAMLNRVYQNSIMKYDVNFAKKRWESKFNEKMPAKVQVTLEIQQEKIKQLEKDVLNLEKQIGTLKEQESFENIKNIFIKNKKKPTSENLKKAAKYIRKAKFTKSISDLSKLQSDPTGIVKGAFDGAVEVVALSLEAGASISASVNKGIQYIKKTEWFKKLSSKSKTQAEKIIRKDLTNIVKDELSIPTENKNIEQGDIKIPNDVIYKLVEGGVKNISELTSGVKDYLKDKYPNATTREVRDAITKYGQQVNETSDDVKLKIKKLKIDGRQISAIEDLLLGKRPLRSGAKRASLTPDQRNRLKKINELIKDLPENKQPTEEYYKTALEAYKKRTENRIKDLQDAIDKSERIFKTNKRLSLDQEARDLKSKKDDLQKEYNEVFGKVEKTYKARVDEAVNRKENLLEKLEKEKEYALAYGKQKGKTKKQTVESDKITELDNKIKKTREELNELFESIGVAEAKRLQQMKTRVANKIKDYQERLKNKDFSEKKKKTTKYDKELIALKKQLIEEKIKYDIPFEKEEYSKLNIVEKAFDLTFKILNTTKSTLASFDLSAMLRQGALIGAANPLLFAKATKEMHKFVVNEGYYKEFMAKLESSDDYITMIESGLSITDTSGDVLRSEEEFVGNLLTTELKVLGKNVNVVGLGMEMSERAYSGFLNHLRVDVFRKGAKVLEAQNITPYNSPDTYKQLSEFVNNTSGRGPMTTDRNLAKALNLIFFSPRMITGMFSLLRTIGKKDTTPYVRKEAIKSLAAFTAYQVLAKYLIASVYGAITPDEEEEVISVDYNPVSTDFNKLRIGEVRYDASAGWGIMIRTLARFATNQKSKNIYSKNEDINKTRGQNVFSEASNFLKNKMSPSVRQFYKWKVNEHPTDIYKKREEATLYNYAEAILIPLNIAQLISGYEKKDPVRKQVLNNVLALYGIGVQEYSTGKKGSKKAKTSRRKSSGVIWE